MAIYDPFAKQLVTAFDLPVIRTQVGRSKEAEIDARALAEDIANAVCECGVMAVAIEDVHSSPQMGVKSAMNFGDTRGQILAAARILHGNVILVSPSKWKVRMMVQGEKKIALERARKLFGTSPWFTREKDHNKAEAALIALYAAQDLVDLNACEFCDGSGWFYSEPELGPCGCKGEVDPLS